MADTNTVQTAAKAAPKFQPFGAHGLQYAMQGDSLLVLIPCGKQAANGATISKSGKNRLIASTAGWTTIPAGPAGLRLNVMAMLPLAPG